MKKLIACVLAVSLLLSVSALAAISDPYSIDKDVTLMSLSPADSGVALASSDSDSQLLAEIGNNVNTILRLLDGDYTISDLYSVVSWIEDPLLSDGNGTYYVEEIMNSVSSSDSILSDIYSALVNSQDVAYLKQINGNLVDLFYFFDPEDDGLSLAGVLSPLKTSIDAVTTKIENQTKVNKGVSILGSDGEPTTTSAATTITYLLRLGLLGLDESVDTVDSSVDEFNASVTDLLTLTEGNSFLRSDGFVTTVSSGYTYPVDRVIGSGFSGLAQMLQLTEGQSYLLPSGVVGSVSSGNTLFMDRVVGEGFSGLAQMMQLTGGQSYLSGNAKITTVADGATLYLDRVVGEGFSGLGNMLQLSEGNTYLGTDGKEYQLSSGNVVGLDRVTARGFSGIRSLIAGSEADNVYQGSVTSNENTEASFSATGMAPMLNTWLDAIQLDTGRLSYIFASPSDIQAKKDAETVTEAASDSFLDPDSDASVKLSDVGVLKDTSSKIKQLGDTGVSVTQFFGQLGDSELFSYFSQETANDLNGTVQTYSRDSSTQIVTNAYEQSRVEFYQLLGRGE